MENLLIDIQKRSVWMMGQTVKIIQHITADLSQQDATTYRDGGDGWTVLEVLCHLRDFDNIFHNRARMMITVPNPELAAFDHDRMAIEGNYNQQDLKTVVTSLSNSRARVRQFYKKLTPEQWQMEGNHPERDRFTMTDSVQQYGLHDTTHIEQILKILREKK